MTKQQLTEHAVPGVCMLRQAVYVCVQVAAVSGDVRRCLELLRRAAEITEAKTKQAGLRHSQPSVTGQAPLTGRLCPALPGTWSLTTCTSNEQSN